MQLEERATIRKANLIPESAVPSFVTPINNGTGYRVCSFTNAELSYEVNCEDAYVVGCTCPVYAHRKKTSSDARGSSQGMLTTPNVTTAAPESISSRVKAVLARMNNALKRSYIDDDDAGKEFLEAALRLEAEFNRVAKIGHNTKLRRQN
ncbi:hypothetical protein BX666DRAFT_2032973 [Dichotomocladium elegans]|nr:hypothetical protein BX666DRAFT_2032973 [Dichotomocladium elegans]